MQDLLLLQWTADTLPGRMLEAAAAMAAKGHIPVADVPLTTSEILVLPTQGS